MKQYSDLIAHSYFNIFISPDVLVEGSSIWSGLTSLADTCAGCSDVSASWSPVGRIITLVLKLFLFSGRGVSSKKFDWFGANSTHPLLENRWIVHAAIAQCTCVLWYVNWCEYNASCVLHLYTNHECHTMILVFGLKHFQDGCNY